MCIREWQDWQVRSQYDSTLVDRSPFPTNAPVSSLRMICKTSPLSIVRRTVDASNVRCDSWPG